MHELPEVESIRKYLAGTVTGREIILIEYSGKFDFFGEDRNTFHSLFINRKISALQRIGKYLFFEIHGNKNIVLFNFKNGEGFTHGSLYSEKERSQRDKKPFVFKFVFKDGTYLAYHNQKRIAKFFILKCNHGDSRKIVYDKFQHGIDALSLDLVSFDSSLNEANGLNCIMFLGSQKYISGIGSIYSSEILFDCNISPLKKINDLTIQERISLLKSIKNVLNNSISVNGIDSSFYSLPNGMRGEFNGSLKVFDREFNACLNCRSQILKGIHKNKVYYYCKKCQI